MHEFSIAEALAGQVRRHLPPGSRLRAVEVRIGAQRGLEPEALRMCWDAVTYDTPMAGSILELDVRPWTIACAVCGREWPSEVPFVTCACGNEAPRPTGTDELDLIALSVDEPDEAASGLGLAAPEPSGAAGSGR